MSKPDTPAWLESRLDNAAAVGSIKPMVGILQRATRKATIAGRLHDEDPTNMDFEGRVLIWLKVEEACRERIHGVNARMAGDIDRAMRHEVASETALRHLTYLTGRAVDPRL